MNKKTSLGKGLPGFGSHRRRGNIGIPSIFGKKIVKSEAKRGTPDDLHDVIFVFNRENIIQPIKGMMLIARQKGKINVDLQSAEALLNQSDVARFSYARYYGQPDSKELKAILKMMYKRNEKMQRCEKVIVLFRADIPFKTAVEVMGMIGEETDANNLIFGIYPDEAESDTELYMYGLV